MSAFDNNKIDCTKISKESSLGPSSSPRARKGFFFGYISRIARDKAECFKRSQLLIILVICTAVLIFQAAECVEKYLNFSTGTGDKYVHLSKTSFPVLTVCATYPYKMDRLLAHGISYKNKLQLEAHWVSNNSSVSALQFYEDVVLRVTDMVNTVRIFTEASINGTNNFLINATENSCCGKSLFKRTYYYYNGDCYQLVLPQCLRDAGALEVFFTFWDTMDIFVHHEGQFLSPNSSCMVFPNYPH